MLCRTHSTGICCVRALLLCPLKVLCLLAVSNEVDRNYPLKIDQIGRSAARKG